MYKQLSKQILMSLLLLGSMSQGALADDPKAPPPPKWYDTITVSGLVDAYYTYNSNTNGGAASSQSGLNKYYSFNAQANSLAVNMVELNIVKPVDDKNKAGFTIGLAFGEAADMLAGNGANTIVPSATSYGTNSETSSKNLRQAYASMILIPNLQLDFGKYVTQMGAEVIESKDNWNYTRSLLFTLAEPAYHSGARLTYTVNDALFVQG